MVIQTRNLDHFGRPYWWTYLASTLGLDTCIRRGRTFGVIICREHMTSTLDGDDLRVLLYIWNELLHITVHAVKIASYIYNLIDDARRSCSYLDILYILSCFVSFSRWLELNFSLKILSEATVTTSSGSLFQESIIRRKIENNSESETMTMMHGQE